MLRPAQIHFHPRKPAIYVDYSVNSTIVGDPKSRRRLIPIRGLNQSKSESHNAAALAEKLLLRHTDLLAHVGRERLRVIVQRAIGIAAGDIAGDWNRTVGFDDDCGDRKDAKCKSDDTGGSLPIVESIHTQQASKPANTHDTSLGAKQFVIDGNTDLNKLGDTELRQIKHELDRQFDKIRIKPDDPHFVYDRRIEFTKDEDKDDNDWDADEESDVEYTPSQPQSVQAQAQSVHDSLTVKPAAPSPSTSQSVNAASIVSPALTVPESPSMANPSSQSSPQSASIANLLPDKKKTPAFLDILAPSPAASSPAASVISELPCEDVPSQLSSAAASPVQVPIKSPAADPVAESPSLNPPSPVPRPAVATPSSLLPVRQLAPGGITILPADPIPEDAYEDDFSDFGAGETASHVSSKSNSVNHSRSSTHESAADIEIGATDSEPESDADEDEQGSSRADSGAAPTSSSAFPTLVTAAKAPIVAVVKEPLKPVGPLVSMHEASDIEEDIDEEIEVFEDEPLAADN